MTSVHIQQDKLESYVSLKEGSEDPIHSVIVEGLVKRQESEKAQFLRSFSDKPSQAGEIKILDSALLHEQEESIHTDLFLTRHTVFQLSYMTG
jgi:hypothetical protein